MPLDIRALIAAHAGEASALYEAHVNPRLAKALRLIGFDRNYVRGSGAYLWDDKGRRYLDMLSGYGVYNAGRNHPAIRQALIDFMMADGASLVQMETPALCGLLAQQLKRRCERDSNNLFLSTGAEATETALKFARRATGPPHPLCREILPRAHHRGLVGSMAATSSARASVRCHSPAGCRSATSRRWRPPCRTATSPASSSSRSRARASTFHHRAPAMSPRPAACAAAMAPC